MNSSTKPWCAGSLVVFMMGFGAGFALNWVMQPPVLQPRTFTHLDGANANSECPENSNILKLVKTPECLRGAVPDVVDFIDMVGVGGSDSRLKLVAWNKSTTTGEKTANLDSVTQLIAVAPGQKPSVLWKDDEPEEGYLYAPKFYVNPDFKYHGHQLYLLVRQTCLTHVVAEPLWITDNSVRSLAKLESDLFDVQILKGLKSGAKARLISRARDPGIPVYELPTILDWTGSTFEQSKDFFPDFFHAEMAKQVWMPGGAAASFAKAFYLEGAGEHRQALKQCEKTDVTSPSACNYVFQPEACLSLNALKQRITESL